MYSNSNKCRFVCNHTIYYHNLYSHYAFWYFLKQPENIWKHLPPSPPPTLIRNLDPPLPLPQSLNT